LGPAEVEKISSKNKKKKREKKKKKNITAFEGEWLAPKQGEFNSRNRGEKRKTADGWAE